MPSTTTTLGALALAAGLALTMGVAGPAGAATRTFDDAVGDIEHGVDIESVKVVNEKNVRVVVQHDDLVRSFRSGASMTVYLDTDRSEPGPEFGLAGALFEGGDYGLLPTVGDGWRLSRRAIPLTCSYESRLDYAADVTRIRIAGPASTGRARCAWRSGQAVSSPTATSSGTGWAPRAPSPRGSPGADPPARRFPSTTGQPAATRATATAQSPRPRPWALYAFMQHQGCQQDRGGGVQRREHP